MGRGPLQKGGGTTGSESVNGTSGVLNSVCSFYTQDEQVLTTSASALNFNFAFDVSWPQDEKTLSSPTADYGGMVAGVVARYQNASDVDSSVLQDERQLGRQRRHARAHAAGPEQRHDPGGRGLPPQRQHRHRPHRRLPERRAPTGTT